MYLIIHAYMKNVYRCIETHATFVGWYTYIHSVYMYTSLPRSKPSSALLFRPRCQAAAPENLLNRSNQASWQESRFVFRSRYGSTSSKLSLLCTCKEQHMMWYGCRNLSFRDVPFQGMRPFIIQGHKALQGLSKPFPRFCLS